MGARTMTMTFVELEGLTPNVEKIIVRPEAVNAIALNNGHVNIVLAGDSEPYSVKGTLQEVMDKLGIRPGASNKQATKSDDKTPPAMPGTPGR